MSKAYSLLAAVLAIVLSVSGQATAASPTGFDVQFTDCVESIGVDLVPTALAQTMIPEGFVLVGDGTPVTPIVVRTCRCGGIAVAGGRPRPGVVVQIGLVIVPPDFSGDIDIYTLWYYTTDARLAHHLNKLGMDAQHVSDIDYDYVPLPAGQSTPFSVTVPRPGSPVLTLDGFVARSSTLAGSFEAIWWASSDDGVLRMDTTVPEIFIGDADLTLSTPLSSSLGWLIGDDELDFVILQQFNTFTRAGMDVRLISP